MLVFLLVPFIYLLLGTFLARAHVTASREIDCNLLASDIARELDGLTHQANCWVGPRFESWRTSRHLCDCNNSSKHRSLYRRYVRAQHGESVNPYPMVFAWPFLGYHNFLISGTPRPSAVEISNADRIAELEKELSIG